MGAFSQVLHRSVECMMEKLCVRDELIAMFNGDFYDPIRNSLIIANYFPINDANNIYLRAARYSLMLFSVSQQLYLIAARS